MTQKDETPHRRQPGEASRCDCVRGCDSVNATPAPPKKQHRLHPLARRGLENLRNELRYSSGDLTALSTIAAIEHILRNH